MPFPLTRRRLLAASSAAVASLALPGAAYAAATDKRFVFVIQRGAADGLAILQPHGDRAARDLRAAFIDDDAHDVDGFFKLHPALPETARMFANGEARAWPAVAPSYRSRSHFDAQNVLESGGPAPYALHSGWIGRLLPLLPGSAGPLAMAPTVPLTLRGDLPVATYNNRRVSDPSDDLLERLSTLYAEDDQLAPLWDEAMRTRMLASDIGAGGGRNGEELGTIAAQLLSAPQGPRVVMLETGGWDTHQGQNARLRTQLRGLDGLLSALRTGLGAHWQDTLVLVATEFGRTAAINGTGGTDHGTASAAFLLGGGLGSGAKVQAEWPGLARDRLYQGRDLAPTGDLLELAASSVADHFGIDRGRAMAALRG